jgi:Rrf2 family protein
MELLHKFEYTLVALLELASSYNSGESLQIKEIAALQNIPVRYLEQLLRTLRCGGLIKSIRGTKGGYVLAREPQKITILDAYRCIEGLDAVDTTQKTAEGDVVEEIWQEASIASDSILQKYTLFDLCERRQVRQKQMALMYYI